MLQIYATEAYCVFHFESTFANIWCKFLKADADFASLNLLIIFYKFYNYTWIVIYCHCKGLTKYMSEVYHCVSWSEPFAFLPYQWMMLFSCGLYAVPFICSHFGTNYNCTDGAIFISQCICQLLCQHYTNLNFTISSFVKRKQ